MQIGDQTWHFPSQPRVLSTGTAVGPMEGAGPLGDSFDLVYADAYMGQSSWEKAERTLFELAQDHAVRQAGLSMEAIDLIVSGDLLPQNISSNFAARTAGRPLIGVFSACATSMEAVAQAALFIDSGFAHYVLAGAVSHNSTAERTFRYPTEYGAQKPPSAHCTVTGAGAVVLGRGEARIGVSFATIGKVVDFGVSSPWEMGAAMAPAAVATIVAHLKDTGRTVADYDAIATGDLARVGLPIARELLAEQGVDVGSRLQDCGVLMYGADQKEAFSGGSGPGCCPCVTFAHLLPKIASGQWRRVLVVATGALLSAVSAGQGETIPCIAHAVSFESVDALTQGGEPS